MRYLLPEDVAFEVRALAGRGAVTAVDIDEAGLPDGLWVMTAGSGPLQIAVKGNAHADEPSGTVTCVQFAKWLADDPAGQELAQRVTWHLLPTANPLGLEKNRGWLQSDPPDLLTWLRYVHRDRPPEDREFGYGNRPDDAILPECRAWHRYLDGLPGLHGYVTLHSMAFGGGAWFLVALDDPERHHELLDSLAEMVTEECGGDLPLHDEDRAGRRGFHRVRPGFCTAPTREEMVAFFSGATRASMRRKLRLNSIMAARMRHRVPVSLVSELPLWWDPCLGDMTPTEERRADVDRWMADKLAAVNDELWALGRLMGRWGDEEDDTVSELKYRELLRKATYERAEEWGDERAAVRDRAGAELTVMLARAYNAAAGIRLHRLERSDATLSVLVLLERAAEIEQRFALRALLLDQQVALQCGMLRRLAEHLQTERGR